MPTYLISRLGDPLFALAVGISAAMTRIRREQQEKQPERASEIGYGTILQIGRDRVRKWWGGEFRGL